MPCHAFFRLSSPRAGVAVRTCRQALLLASLVAIIPSAIAESVTPPVLKPGQVSESALVDALALEEPDAPAADGLLTRGLRPAATGAVKVAERKPSGPGKASLLITFATGSAELTSESQAVLETVAKALQSDRLAGFSFSVEGHADPRGASDANQKLSAERAASVVQFLTQRFGILPERLASVGKGATEPLNTSRPDAPENRRVTIITRR